MRAGKSFSLLLAGLLGAVSALVAVLVTHLPVLHEQLHEPNAVVEALKLYGIFSLLFLAILFPIGASLDRTLLRLRRSIEDAARTGHRSEPPRGPRWLRPLLHAFSAAVECYQQDRARLRDELRDAESTRAALDTKRRHSEAVLHTLRDAVIVTDEDDRIVIINDAAAELFGLEPDEVLLRPLGQVVPVTRLVELVRALREDGRPRAVRNEEIVIRLPAGPGREGVSGEGTFHACLMCVEHDGRAGGVVAVLHDLTREREMTSLKTDFISRASHELRTPLSSIRAYIEMLIDGEARDDTARQQFYGIIHEEADRLARLIDNLLNVSRIEAGLAQIQRRRLTVKSVVDDALRALAPSAREKGITLVSKVLTPSPAIHADRDMIHELLLNLVANAVQFTPAGGTVTVEAEHDAAADETVVSVSDTGPGIPADAQARVFEKFYRLDHGDPKAAGTGLGLTVCKHIVETLHHGRIGVESEPGAGARFWFALAARSESSRTAA